MKAIVAFVVALGMLIRPAFADNFDGTYPGSAITQTAYAYCRTFPITLHAASDDISFESQRDGHHATKLMPDGTFTFQYVVIGTAGLRTNFTLTGKIVGTDIAGTGAATGGPTSCNYKLEAHKRSS